MRGKMERTLLDPNIDAKWKTKRQAWIVYDNNSSTAQMIKDQYPDDPVILHNRDTGEEEQFFIEIKVKNPRMKNGKFIGEDEIIKI